jgi:hypothetical protein
MNRRETSLFVAGVASLCALAVAGLLVPVRDDINNANVALVLMAVVIVAGALGGRVAGLIVAAVAGLSFNFFHTQPYSSLKIASANDIVSLALLVVGGLLVGELAARRAGTVDDRRRFEADLLCLERFALVVGADVPLPQVWADARAEIGRVLGADAVWFEPSTSVSASAALPVLDWDGVHGVRVHRWLGNGFALPVEGVQIMLADGSGRVVVRPNRNLALPSYARRHAVAVAALLASAIAREPGGWQAMVDRDDDL